MVNLDVGPKHGHENFINAIIELKGFSSYLEIGTHYDYCFNAIKCAKKVGVDPLNGGTLRMTSDEFFAQNTEKFDLIFIDGSHHHDQVKTDVENSLFCLNLGGLIVMHDCNPPTREFEAQTACGTAWRAFAHLRQRDDINMIVGDFDLGVGLVRVEPNDDVQKLTENFQTLDYSLLESSRGSLLRLKTPNDAFEWATK